MQDGDARASAGCWHRQVIGERGAFRKQALDIIDHEAARIVERRHQRQDRGRIAHDVVRNGADQQSCIADARTFQNADALDLRIGHRVGDLALITVQPDRPDSAAMPAGKRTLASIHFGSD